MSAMNAIATALVARWSGLAVAGGTLAVLSVFDGPPVISVSASDLVIVGDDGSTEESDQNTYQQEWLDLRHSRRQETGQILCGAIADSGGTVTQYVRDRAEAWVHACEVALYADNTLGGAAMSSELISASPRTLQNNAGAAALVPFVIRYWAITTTT